MARTNSDDLLMEDDIAAAFLGNEEEAVAQPEEPEVAVVEEEQQAVEESADDEWVDADDFPGQLAVDVYETADKLVVKARTAGISKADLDVSISDNILTISGVLSGVKTSKLRVGTFRNAIGVSFRERLRCQCRCVKMKTASKPS